MFYIFGLWSFLRRKYLLFYTIFILGTFNRESTCFISISLLIILFKNNPKYDFINNIYTNILLIKHIFFQFIIWFILVLFISYLVKDSAGETYEMTLSFSRFVYDMWNNQPSWPYLDCSQFLGNPRCFITIFAGIWLIVIFVWKYIPLKSKRMLILIPIYMFPAFLYANLMESRVYHEINIVISIAAVSGLIEFFRNRSIIDHCDA